jgi:26S proteasome regulatory subunit N5
MSDGTIRKPDKDFSKEVDKQLPEAEELAKVHPDFEFLDP